MQQHAQQRPPATPQIIKTDVGRLAEATCEAAAASPADTVSDLDFSAAVMAAEAGAAVDGDDPPLVPAEPVVDSLGGGGLCKEGGELCKGGGAGGGGNAGTGGGLGFGGGGGGGEGGGDGGGGGVGGGGELKGGGYGARAMPSSSYWQKSHIWHSHREQWWWFSWHQGLQNLKSNVPRPSLHGVDLLEKLGISLQ